MTTDSIDAGTKGGAAAGLEIGSVVEARYEILSRLGSGGVGEVYLAQHARLHREVAIKVLQPGFAASEKLRLRFEREAHALATMCHPNIVAVIDYGVAGDAPFLVMERLVGETLAARLKRGALEPREAVRVLRQILRALDFAHRQGWVHRDLKPGNIFLRDLVGGAIHVTILDFGLAKMVTAEGRDQGPKLTLAGMVFGTPAYMAPEQAVGAETDERTDLYTAGAVFFEMLAGRRPFRGEPDQLMRQHLQVPPPLLREVVPSLRAAPALDALLHVALAKERGDRFQSAADMLAAVDALPSPPVLATVAAAQGPVDGSGQTVPDARDEDATPREGAVAVSPAVGAVARGFAAAPGERDAAGASLAGSGGPRGGEGAGWGQRWRLVAAVAAGAVIGAAAAGPAAWRLARDPSPRRVAHTVETTRAAGAPVDRAADEGSVARPPPPGAEVRPASADFTVRPAGALPSPRGAARGLWGAPGVPGLLQEGKAHIDAGQALPASLLAQTRRYAREHPDDPRPLLVLARHHVLRGALSDGIDRYERAFDASPSAREDAAMLDDLVSLSRSRAVGATAARAVARIYGADAAARIVAELDRPDLDDGERRRLEELRRRIVGF